MGLCTIFVSSGVFPFRHGARPVSTKYNVCTKMQLFGVACTPQNLCGWDFQKKPADECSKTLAEACTPAVSLLRQTKKDSYD
jgi:hypothetical protein